MVEKPRTDERGRDSRLMSEGVLRRTPCSPWWCCPGRGVLKKRAVDGIKRYVAPDNCCKQRLTEVLQMR